MKLHLKEKKKQWEDVCTETISETMAKRIITSPADIEVNLQDAEVSKQCNKQLKGLC